MTQQTPVLVGVSHLEQRFTDFDSAKEPIELMIEAVKQAAQDEYRGLLGHNSLQNSGSSSPGRGLQCAA